VNTELTVKRVLLERAVNRDRAKLQRALHHLQNAVRTRADVGHYIAEKPYHWLAGGFFLGFLLGLRAGPRR